MRVPFFLLCSVAKQAPYYRHNREPPPDLVYLKVDHQRQVITGIRVKHVEVGYPDPGCRLLGSGILRGLEVINMLTLTFQEPKKALYIKRLDPNVKQGRHCLLLRGAS